MAKKKTKKKGKSGIVFILLVVIIAAVIYTMFFAMPDGDAVKSLMEKKEFNVFTDVNKDTLIWGAFLPENAVRSITFTKTLNGKLYTVLIIYFDDFQSAKAYYDTLDEAEEGEASYLRGNAVISGSEDSVKKLRWVVWAI